MRLAAAFFLRRAPRPERIFPPPGFPNHYYYHTPHIILLNFICNNIKGCVYYNSGSKEILHTSILLKKGPIFFISNNKKRKNHTDCILQILIWLEHSTHKKTHSLTKTPLFCTTPSPPLFTNRN